MLDCGVMCCRLVPDDKTPLEGLKKAASRLAGGDGAEGGGLEEMTAAEKALEEALQKVRQRKEEKIREEQVNVSRHLSRQVPCRRLKDREESREIHIIILRRRYKRAAL